MLPQAIGLMVRSYQTVYVDVFLRDLDNDPRRPFLQCQVPLALTKDGRADGDRYGLGNRSDGDVVGQRLLLRSGRRHFPATQASGLKPGWQASP